MVSSSCVFVGEVEANENFKVYHKTDVLYVTLRATRYLTKSGGLSTPQFVKSITDCLTCPILSIIWHADTVLNQTAGSGIAYFVYTNGFGGEAPLTWCQFYAAMILIFMSRENSSIISLIKQPRVAYHHQEQEHVLSLSHTVFPCYEITYYYLQIC